ncbi:DNA helicase UvrD [Thiohalocapsa marina]|uniref:DNA 3'-5' helicase II n=1 Tax=Thiohalocapsa marina TaxID=424902 RepID=A0A5M8FE15_9GAMM|nr:ATP-binding domain-containing protein [Thiohalocapsa marina]KAA6182150.1 DNA helicase UvrD [Thiohalocapsa marina]
MTDQANEYLKAVSSETLANFKAIAAAAQERLDAARTSGADAFIHTNTFNSGVAASKKLSAISATNVTGYRELTREPAICRVQALDEEGERHTYYIARKSTVALHNGSKLASYGSVVGRLASLTVGTEITLQIAGKSRHFELLENIKYQPRFKDGAWDSLNTTVQGEDFGPLTVESLQALLRGRLEEADAEALLDALLQGSPSDTVLEGLRHEVRRSMALRDQPILDRFQDEIFRLPLDSQLLILGPPGTGKTTTLIRRLGQKLDRALLTPEETSLVERIDHPQQPHEQSWVMFTPTDLLKHFVKEAFSREQVPASDARIKTWETQRGELARNTLGILQQSSSETGRFVLKASSHHLRPAVEQAPTQWFDALHAFHKQRLLGQLQQGLTILVQLHHVVGADLVRSLVDIMATAEGGDLMAAYRALDGLESQLIPLLKSLKEESDQSVRKGLIRSLNQDRDFVDQLAAFIDSLQVDDEADADGEFDDDAGDEPEQQQTSSQKAVQVYNRSIRTLARLTFLKRSVPKTSAAAKIRDWLGKSRLPLKDELHSIGESIAAQNGLRRFVNASRRSVSEVPASYRQFRREAVKANQWYDGQIQHPRHLDAMELDAVLLLTLRTARELMAQPFVARNRTEPRFAFLQTIRDRLYNQVLVDEATDFSPLQLACMASLTRLETNAFFACGDFNQRITQWGTRTHDQALWAVSRIDTRPITTVYRQSQRLNAFSAKLLEILGGDLDCRGQLPEHLHHTGVSPSLLEDAGDFQDVAIWLVERIQEVEKIVNIGELPTIAVLVNAEEQVKPMAESLNHLLEDINLRAVACADGQSLGVGSDVRVFSVEHIKGLEFEAVFFVGIDDLAQQWPDLFGRFLYVGATRAATYLGLTCRAKLPPALESMRAELVSAWS